MRMPDTSGLGDYTECGQVIQVRFGEAKGEYLHAMYLDNLPALASGREISGYPKVIGKPRLYIDSDTLVGTMDYGSLRVAIPRSTSFLRSVLRLSPRMRAARTWLPSARRIACSRCTEMKSCP